MNTRDETSGFQADDLLSIKQGTFVREIEHHQAIASTNSRALAIAPQPQLTLPMLVLADEQTAGRGRGVHRWWSARGALTFSIILDCSAMEDASNWPRVSLTTGIAVCAALHQLCPGLAAGVKWPNDVYVRNRKICGILVEVPPPPGGRLVVGVGINVNNAFENAPEPVRTIGTSLLEAAGYRFSLVTVLTAVLQQLATHLDLLAHQPETLQQRWQDFCMLAGRQVRIVAGTRRITGTCQGIDARGALLVETKLGVQPCLSGIVTLVE